MVTSTTFIALSPTFQTESTAFPNENSLLKQLIRIDFTLISVMQPAMERSPLVWSELVYVISWTVYDVNFHRGSFPAAKLHACSAATVLSKRWSLTNTNIKKTSLVHGHAHPPAAQA